MLIKNNGKIYTKLVTITLFLDGRIGGDLFTFWLMDSFIHPTNASHLSCSVEKPVVSEPVQVSEVCCAGLSAAQSMGPQAC